MNHAFFGLQFSFESGLDVIGEVVNDVVFANLDAAILGQGAGPFVRHYVEPDNDRVLRRREGQRYVAFRDAANADMKNTNANFFVMEFFELFANRLDRTAEIRFYNDLELRDLVGTKVLQPDRFTLDKGRLLLLDFALFSDGASHGQVRDNLERIVGIGNGIEPRNLD